MPYFMRLVCRTHFFACTLYNSFSIAFRLALHASLHMFIVLVADEFETVRVALLMKLVASHQLTVSVLCWLFGFIGSESVLVLGHSSYCSVCLHAFMA